MGRRSSVEQRSHYQTRILACLVASLVLVLALVRFWPIRASAERESFVEARPQEVVALEEIVPTRQPREQNPPPPAPLPPIVVPDDEIIEAEELVLDEGFELSDTYGDDRFNVPGDPVGDDPAPAQETYVSARAVRIVEPEYTRAARRQRVRAEVHVEVEIDAEGRVRTTRITDRFLVGEDDDVLQAVPEIGYGIEDAARSAAQRWTFRPARRNGRPVDSSTTLTFRFGV